MNPYSIEKIKNTKTAVPRIVKILLISTLVGTMGCSGVFPNSLHKLHKGSKNSAKQNKNVPRVAFSWPAEGLILRQAKGVDIAGRLGTPIKAAAAGTVTYSGNGLKQYGNLIIIKHTEELSTVYAHNQELKVREGEAVSKGQIIALMGNTAANRVKLHFEVRAQGKPQDAFKYLPKI